MTERAAHLVDAVLPRVPVRQWVLTVPYRLRYQMAWDHGLSRAVLGVYTRVLLDVYAQGLRRSPETPGVCSAEMTQAVEESGRLRHEKVIFGPGQACGKCGHQKADAHTSHRPADWCKNASRKRERVTLYEHKRCISRERRGFSLWKTRSAGWSWKNESRMSRSPLNSPRSLNPCSVAVSM